MKTTGEIMKYELRKIGKNNDFMKAGIVTTICIILIAMSFTFVVNAQEFDTNSTFNHRQDLSPDVNPALNGKFLSNDDSIRADYNRDKSTADNVMDLPEGIQYPTDSFLDMDSNLETLFVPGEIIVKLKSEVDIDRTTSEKGIVNIGVSSVDNLNTMYHVTAMEQMYHRSCFSQDFQAPADIPRG